MRTTLTRKQSDHLFALGIPRSKATHVVQVIKGGERHSEFERYFTVTDLIDILPKELNGEPIVITYGGTYMGDDLDIWFTYYDDMQSKMCSATELVDSLYELTIWLIKKNLM